MKKTDIRFTHIVLFINNIKLIYDIKMELNKGSVVEGKSVNLHFLNVGKGNCTIVEFPSGRLSIIDIDNSTSEDDNDVTDPIEYIQSSYEGRNIFRFILTHPDMDHMSGLDELSGSFSIANFWDTNNNKTIDDWENSPYKKEDWDKYQEFRKSEESPKCIMARRGATSSCCYVEDGVTILSPTTKLENLANETTEYNHVSYVTMIEYSGLRVLLGGDATVEVWEDILEECGEDYLKAHIFLAPHHGSKNNVCEEAFEAVAPDYVIASMSEGTDYAYDYYKELAEKDVYSTKHYGNIDVELKSTSRYTITRERNA